jgi:hypothetical protein
MTCFPVSVGIGTGRNVRYAAGSAAKADIAGSSGRAIADMTTFIR